MFHEDGKGMDAMTSNVYFRLVNDSARNKSGNNKRSAALNMFGNSMKAHNGGYLATGGEIFEINAMPVCNGRDVLQALQQE